MRAPRRLRCPLPATIAAAVALATLALAPGAAAAISGATVLDGPSAEVTEIGDAAMAGDGSGGVVYLKQAEGSDHVFVVRFVDGAWSAPLRVDLGQAFDSSWPRIAAGDGGRLLVTWVQEFGVGSDRMFSASLDPGAKGFKGPVPVDLNVGEATQTFPDLAMNAGGQAYLAYLVVTDNSTANPKGFLGINVRVARYNSRLWSVLGNAADRNPATPMPEPAEATGPQVGVDVNGGAVVAWREPDDEFVNRIWARRVFGINYGIPLQVSPASWDGAPLRAPADAFSMDDAGFGQVAIAFRQQPGQAPALGGAPRLMVNEMPDAFAEGASRFSEARVVDGGIREGLGAPNVAVEPEGAFVVGFGASTATLLGGGDNFDVGAVRRIDQGGAEAGTEPEVDVAESGASVAAWGELAGGGGRVAIREIGADGVADDVVVGAPGAGVVARLVLGGSGLGDGLVAWRQGSGTKGQVAAAFVDAPPEKFPIETPEGWQRRTRIPIRWTEAPNAIGGLRYALTVDDEQIGKRTRKLRALVKRARVGEGRHLVEVFAIDDGGQETASRRRTLLLDGKPPNLTLRRRGSKLTVVVSDGARGETAGVSRKKVKASFGDTPGGKAKGGGGGGEKGASVISRLARRGKGGPIAIRHRYREPGTYRVRVVVTDRAGNVASLTRKVRVR
ncbi:MAG TPA: PKD domain-containing protein [Solirubrobacterales bacterium]